MREVRVLRRAFLDQFLSGEGVASESQFQQSLAWTFVFLLVPGAFALVQLFPDFQAAVIAAHLGRAPITAIDDFLAWIAFFVTTYSMVVAGFVTILTWHALAINRRDALVLGSLPLKPYTILLAKLSALGVVLLAVSLSVSTVNGVMFALITSDQLGAVVFVRHLVAMFISSLGACVFVVAAIVALRNGITFAFGTAAAEASGPPMQFLCVVLVLLLIFLSPAVWQVPFMTSTMTGWMPSAWFLGVFELLRGSPRAADPAFPFATYVWRAWTGTAGVLIGAALLSVGVFHREFRAAVAHRATPGLIGGALVSRAITAFLTVWNGAARSIANFTLLTLARNRRQQLPIAMYSAVGAAIAIVALSQGTTSLAALMHPRAAVLWFPLVMAFSMTMGLRASFNEPSELPSSWSFRIVPRNRFSAVRCGVRAAMAGFVLPRVAATTIVLVPLIGWRLTAWHALIVFLLCVVLINIAACTVSHVPFTRLYEPGHARLRSRWIFYAAGFYLFAYIPVRIEQGLEFRPEAMRWFAGGLALMAALTEILVRRPVPDDTEIVDAHEEATYGISVLALEGAIHQR